MGSNGNFLALINQENEKLQPLNKIDENKKENNMKISTDMSINNTIRFDFSFAFKGTDDERILLNDKLLDQLKFNDIPIEIDKYCTNLISNIAISILEMIEMMNVKDLFYPTYSDIYISLIDINDRNINILDSFVKFGSRLININKFDMAIHDILEKLSKRIYLGKYRIHAKYSSNLNKMLFYIISDTDKIITIEEFNQLTKQYSYDIETEIFKSNTIFIIINDSLDKGIQRISEYPTISNEELLNYFLLYYYDREIRYNNIFSDDKEADFYSIPIKRYQIKKFFFFTKQKEEKYTFIPPEKGLFNKTECLFYLLMALGRENIRMQDLCIEFGDTIKYIFDTYRKLHNYEYEILSKDALQEIKKAKLENEALAINLFRTIVTFIRPILDDNYNRAIGMDISNKLETDKKKLSKEALILQEIKELSQENKCRQEFLSYMKK